MKFKSIIGLEIHIELSTKSKMFCSCSTKYFNQTPNSHTCPICLGLPGALPVPNREAIKACRKIGLALNCNIAKFSKFDRKNYFYPDLPKGYQISQYDIPFCTDGSFIAKNNKKIRIKRVHMEEDTGKLIHDGSATLIDFNRSSVPLVEIVTEPDFSEPDEVSAFLKYLQRVVRYLGVSDANMEKGEMRLEPNISLANKDSSELPNYKVEVKNINSFKFVEKAIGYELKRQEELLLKGQTPLQETRGWNELKQITYSQRTKEEASDYRYFPEPDIPPLVITETEIEAIKKELPELPRAKLERFISKYELPYNYAEFLTRDVKTADFFEESAKIGPEGNIKPKDIANLIVNKKIDTTSINPKDIVEDLKRDKAEELINPDDLQSLIEKVIGENSKAVTDYKEGKEQALMFLLGQISRISKKKINSADTIALLKQKLS